MTATYDRIGLNYANLRQPDPRLASQVAAALGDAEAIVNVGAGAGSYEPEGRQITAVEPSAEMIAQRPPSSARLVQGVAEHLPFDDGAFDAAMAILTIHHWTDQPQGLRELRRVSRGPVVILTYDPGFPGFWLNDYFPQLVAMDAQIMPPMEMYSRWLGQVDIQTVPVPHDCTDGFLYAYWRRPEAYLDDKVRAAMSSFWSAENVEVGLHALRQDLESGRWMDRYGAVMAQQSMDAGYRLVIA